MRVLFVTSECVPFFKLGGLADVSYSLPVSLSKIGVDVSIIMPYYDKIHLSEVMCVGQLAVDYDRKRELVFVFQTFIPGSKVPIFLIRHPLLGNYNGSDMSTHFAFFSKAVSTLYLYASHILGKSYDIVHCHDWHTALIPMYLGENDKVKWGKETLQSAKTKTIITIHNLLYQGETGTSIISKTGLPKKLFHPFTTPLGVAVKLLFEGLDYADVVTTVSPTYAKELELKSFWKHIRRTMERRHDHIVGILNGIDNGIWDPLHDVALPVNYSSKTVHQKKNIVKKALQNAMRLPQEDVPLFGFVGRLEARQKGIDILLQTIAKMKGTKCQFVLLGTGTDEIQAKIKRIASKNPHVAYVPTFDERLARRIYAGADCLLVPSRFEPCGLTQMIAMRYGTIPLVRKTGGLADSVVHRRTGFVFEEYSALALKKTILEAMTLWNKKKIAWQSMMDRVMEQDFSWTVSAKKYKALYKHLL